MKNDELKCCHVVDPALSALGPMAPGDFQA